VGGSDTTAPAPPLLTPLLLRQRVLLLLALAILVSLSWAYLVWMAALTVLMTLEKVVRRGDRLARGAGVALVAAGMVLLLR
jgi:predicted metal-binding membrane protein